MAKPIKKEAGFGGCSAPEKPRPVSAPSAAPTAEPDQNSPEGRYLALKRRERDLRKRDPEGVIFVHAFPHLRKELRELRKEITEAGRTVPKLPRSGNRRN